MKKRNLFGLALTVAIGMGFSTFASAGLLSCDSSGNGYTRTWTFDSADACGVVAGNASNSSIESLSGVFDLGAGDWTHGSGIDSGGDGSLLLNIGGQAWDSKNVNATWSLAAGFWDSHSEAVFTVHVGNGPPGSPLDSAVFYITPNTYSGSWTYVQDPARGGGGGLSNAHLWYTGTGIIIDEPFPVPEPGMLVLFGSALLGLGLVRKRKAKA